MIRKIETLQQLFPSLSSSTSLHDLASRYATVLRGMFPEAEVRLYHRQMLQGAWDTLADTEGGESALLEELAHSPNRPAFAATKNPGRYGHIQRFADSAEFGLVISWPGSSGGMAEGDQQVLQLSASLVDMAYRQMHARRKEKALGFSLNQRLLQLNTLIDTGIEVSKLDHDAFPHRFALERAASLTNASKGVVRIRSGETLKEEITFPVGVHPGGTAEKNHVIRAGFSFDKDSYTFELFDKETRSGVESFDETDQLLLDALAKQVHASLENRFLHQQSLEKQRIEQDIAVAASIQQRIIPRTLPKLKGYDIAGINIPSITVGGDYYDCIPLADGRSALVIADVAGKGVPAALLVSTLHAYIQAYLETTGSVIPLAEKLNRVIHSASTAEKFITASIAILDPMTGEIESVNAGHNPTYVRRKDGSVEELAAGGLALGILEDFPFSAERAVLAPGERLLLYTDGITEARNRDEVLYDTVRPLKDFVARHAPDRAESFITVLTTDISDFTGAAPQSDDITALYLIRQ
jgi:serine phosphatase RsbU (regulator of sigma subunit)